MKRLNSREISKAKESLVNLIIIKIVLLDSRLLLIEACFVFKFLRDVHNVFIGKFLFINLN